MIFLLNSFGEGFLFFFTELVMENYLPPLEPPTQPVLATLYELATRHSMMPVPVVRTVAEYLAGQYVQPHVKVRFTTPPTASHMAAIRGEVPPSWDDPPCLAQLRFEKNVAITSHSGFTVAHMVALVANAAAVAAIPSECLDDATGPGFTLLHMVGIGSPSPGRLEVMQRLVARAPHLLGVPSSHNVSVMYVAVESANTDVVKYLAGVCPAMLGSLTGNGCTVLYAASYRGVFDLVKFFVELRPEMLDIRTHTQATVLSVAAQQGHLDITRYLVSVKPSLLPLLTSQGHNALYLACSFQHHTILKVLMEMAPELLDIHGNDNTSVLAMACHEGFTDSVRILLDARPSLLSVRTVRFGLAPLHFACIKGRINVVRLLVETYSVDVNERCIFMGHETPLQCSYDSRAVFDYLIARGAN